jgi:hypothetical protein
VYYHIASEWPRIKQRPGFDEMKRLLGSDKQQQSVRTLLCRKAMGYLDDAIAIAYRGKRPSACTISDGDGDMNYTSPSSSADSAAPSGKTASVGVEKQRPPLDRRLSMRCPAKLDASYSCQLDLSRSLSMDEIDDDFDELPLPSLDKRLSISSDGCTESPSATSMSEEEEEEETMAEPVTNSYAYMGAVDGAPEVYTDEAAALVGDSSGTDADPTGDLELEIDRGIHEAWDALTDCLLLLAQQKHTTLAQRDEHTAEARRCQRAALSLLLLRHHPKPLLEQQSRGASASGEAWVREAVDYHRARLASLPP